MGLNISLFVHGVPMGQKIWGPKGDDQRYLSSFYGPKWDTPEVMKVDIMTFGGVTYCYYSLVKGLNVCDSQGRSGSYMALTLRINAFYGDMQNMYGILKAAYEKMCVGLCVQESNNVTRYLIADFQNVDAQLKNIESHIINYISEFSIDDDIVSLSEFTVNSQSASPDVNLHECNKRVALDAMKKYGKLMVSPYFLPATAASTVAKYKAEIAATKQKAQQEIQTQQKASQEKIDSVVSEAQAKISSVTLQSQEELRQCKEQARQQVDQAKIENDRKMSELKQSYASVDEKISRLNQTISGRDKEISELKKLHQQTEKELKWRNSDVKKLEEKTNKLQDDVFSLQGNSIGYPAKQTKKKYAFAKNILIVFFVLLLIAVLVYLLMGKFRGKEDKEKIPQERVERLTDENNIRQQQVNRMHTSKQTDLTKEFTISIIHDGEEKNEVSGGDVCIFSLKGNDTENIRDKGKWTCTAFRKCEKDKYIAIRDSAGKTYKIAFVVDGKEIASKNIKIKKD